MTTAGDPTLGELARTLERMETEINRRLAEMATTLSQMVMRDLYEAHRAAMQEDIDQLRQELKGVREERERERERQAASRRMVVGAFLAAALSLLVTIISTALMVALKLNP